MSSGLIVCSGVQRSGTSMIMNLANEAGFKIVGEKFPHDWEQTRTEKGLGKKKAHNRSDTGFWEAPTLVDAGINNLTCLKKSSDLDNYFVKIFSPGIPATSSDFMKKMILCVREWRSHLVSWRKVFIFNVKQTEGIDLYDIRYPYGTEWLYKYGSIIFDYVKRRYPLLIVNFEEMLSDPVKNCDSIKNFVSCGRWDLAAKLVDKKRNRNKKVKLFDKDKEF